MIIYRKVIDSVDDDIISIWKYNTETDMEFCVWHCDDDGFGCWVDNKWSRYHKVFASKEIDISKTEYDELMFVDMI